MQTEDSVYLYSNEQVSLYANVLHELEHRTCPHTHTVYALMDLEESEVPEKMVNHVSKCKECQKTVLLSQAVTSRINGLIPNFETTTPEVLKLNLKRLLQRSEYSLSSKIKIGLRSFASSSLDTFSDIFSVLFSVKMGLTYLVAALMAVLLQLIF